MYRRVASITALMVCMRFSASSNTMEAGDSNTSSVTSISSMPNFSEICLPMAVLRSWNAGRQCINTQSGAAWAMSFELTW